MSMLPDGVGDSWKQPEAFDTDRNLERATIEELGDRQREKWPPDATPRPGFRRRRRRNWFVLLGLLADIQEAHNASLTSFPRDDFPRNLGMRAAMLIWPKVMNPLALYGNVVQRARVRRARKRIGLEGQLFEIFTMAQLKYPSVPYINEVPLISLRRRLPRDIPDFYRESSNAMRNDVIDEIIGRAVIQDYRSSHNIESSWLAVSTVGEIDGVRPGGVSNVKRRYLNFRKLAFRRGFADVRALWKQYENEPWPDDQIWLDEFPK